MTSFSFNSGAKRFSPAAIVSWGKIFIFKLTRTPTIFVDYGAVMAKPIKSRELHYPMIQFLIINDSINLIICILFNGAPSSLVEAYFANIVEFKQDGIIKQ